MNRVIEFAKKAKMASAALTRASTEVKKQALLSIAQALKLHKDDVFAANKKDLDAARELVKQGKMAESLYSRLKVDEEKFNDILTGIEQVASLEEPIGKITLATEIDTGLRLYRVTCPIGVVGVIFESRPDALTQITSLCIKSSNAVMLKGGSEAEQTNRVVFDVLQSAAVEAGIPAEAMVLLESREEVQNLLKADGFVDLIIPRGSNALVSFIQKNTSIPVLGHAEGICHIYIDKEGDPEKATKIVVDAKIQYPAACNAVETILVHRHVAKQILPRIVEALKSNGVKVKGDDSSRNEFGVTGLEKATEEDWKTEYSDLVVSVKVVESLEQAIEHINTYGSHHTESIVTENQETFNRFFTDVDSAGVFLNASTRFSDGFRYGFGAEVGISTGKLHPRGPVGLEGLVTYKYKIIGEGHTVGMYSGPNAKRFIHRPLH